MVVADRVVWTAGCPGCGRVTLWAVVRAEPLGTFAGVAGVDVPAPRPGGGYDWPAHQTC